MCAQGARARDGGRRYIHVGRLTIAAEDIGNNGIFRGVVYVRGESRSSQELKR